MNDRPSHFRDLLTPLSRARYIVWSLTGRKKVLHCTLRDGLELSIRPNPFMDWQVAYEMFFLLQYAVPDAANLSQVANIVDLGANVGYSCLFWAKHYPKASITAFEPHPVHLRLLKQHLESNAVQTHVDLHESAAGIQEGAASLTDADANSSLIVKNGAVKGLIPIKVEDFYTAIGDRPIDILKLDIEGGEYAIMNDPRFEKLPIKYVVLEYHFHPDYPNGKEWCKTRLTSLGYTIADEPERSQLVRAWR